VKKASDVESKSILASDARVLCRVQSFDRHGEPRRMLDFATIGLSRAIHSTLVFDAQRRIEHMARHILPRLTQFVHMYRPAPIRLRVIRPLRTSLE